MNQTDLPTYIVIDEYTRDCIIDALREFGDKHHACTSAFETITLHSDDSVQGLLEICDLTVDEYNAITCALDHFGIADAKRSFEAAIANEQQI